MPKVVRQEFPPLWRFGEFFDEFVGLRKSHASGQGLARGEAKIECFRSAGRPTGFWYVLTGRATNFVETG